MENKIILAKLIAKKASLVAPLMCPFWEAARKNIFIACGGDPAAPSHTIHATLTEDQKEVAYTEGTKQYQLVIEDYFEIESALDFAIKHYKGLIKIDLALNLI